MFSLDVAAMGRPRAAAGVRGGGSPRPGGVEASAALCRKARPQLDLARRLPGLCWLDEALRETTQPPVRPLPQRTNTHTGGASPSGGGEVRPSRLKCQTLLIVALMGGKLRLLSGVLGRRRSSAVFSCFLL